MEGGCVDEESEMRIKQGKRTLPAAAEQNATRLVFDELQ